MISFYPALPSTCQDDLKFSSRLVIIPAAGYGKRVGRPAAKELQPHPIYKEKFQIQHLLDLCHNNQLPCMVISRSDKYALNNQILQWQNNQSYPFMNFLTVSPQHPDFYEWIDTVKFATPYFADHNVIALPDTYWEPQQALITLFETLEQHQLVTLATFQPEYDNTHGSKWSTWGVYCTDHDKDYWLRDKPADNDAKLQDLDCYAWGLMGFPKHKASDLLNNYSNSRWHQQQCITLALKSFRDFTRRKPFST